MHEEKKENKGEEGGIRYERRKIKRARVKETEAGVAQFHGCYDAVALLLLFCGATSLTQYPDTPRIQIFWRARGHINTMMYLYTHVTDPRREADGTEKGKYRTSYKLSIGNMAENSLAVITLPGSKSDNPRIFE